MDTLFIMLEEKLLVFTIDYDVSYEIFICDLYHVEVISFYS